MSNPKILIDGIGGSCPVQAEGTIDGFPFYFRARGEHWSLSIASGEDKDPVFPKDGFTHRERYGNEPFAAGYITNEEAIGFIEKASEVFHAKLEAR